MPERASTSAIRGRSARPPPAVASSRSASSRRWAAVAASRAAIASAAALTRPAGLACQVSSSAASATLGGAHHATGAAARRVAARRPRWLRGPPRRRAPTSHFPASERTSGGRRSRGRAAGPGSGGGLGGRVRRRGWRPVRSGRQAGPRPSGARPRPARDRAHPAARRPAPGVPPRPTRRPARRRRTAAPRPRRGHGRLDRLGVAPVDLAAAAGEGAQQVADHLRRDDLAVHLAGLVTAEQRAQRRDDGQQHLDGRRSVSPGRRTRSSRQSTSFSPRVRPGAPSSADSSGSASA